MMPRTAVGVTLIARGIRLVADQETNGIVTGSFGHGGRIRFVRVSPSGEQR